jgi:hypothetical protein
MSECWIGGVYNYSSSSTIFIVLKDLFLGKEGNQNLNSCFLAFNYLVIKGLECLSEESGLSRLLRYI